MFIEAFYSGDANNTGSSSNSTLININTQQSSIGLVCASPISAGFGSTCNIAISGAFGRVDGERISFSADLGTFDKTTCSLSSSACSVDYYPTSAADFFEIVTATYGGDSNNTGSSASALVIITQPYMILSSRSGEVGTIVTVTGGDLLPSQSLTLTYDGLTLGQPTCATDSSGLVSPDCAVIVPSSSPGVHTVTISDGTNSVSSFFAINIVIDASNDFAGLRASIGGNFTVDTGLNQLAGILFLEANNDTTGASISSKNVAVSIAYGTSTRVAFTLGFADGGYGFGFSCEMTIAGGSFQCLLSRGPDVNGDGSVNILDLAQIAYYFGGVQGSPGYIQQGDLNGDGVINIQDLAIVAFFFKAQVYS